MAYNGETLATLEGLDILRSKLSQATAQDLLELTDAFISTIEGRTPTVGSLTLTASGWTQDEATGLYLQPVTIEGLTAKHRVDLDADYTTEMGLPAAIQPCNENGSFYAVTSTPPETDITVQYTLIWTK